MLGRTPTEALATLNARDVLILAAWEEEYGLPDVYFLAGALGPAILAPYSKGRVPDADAFVPYFRRGPQTAAEMLAAFLGGAGDKVADGRG